MHMPALLHCSIFVGCMSRFHTFPWIVCHICSEVIGILTKKTRQSGFSRQSAAVFLQSPYVLWHRLWMLEALPLCILPFCTSRKLWRSYAITGRARRMKWRACRRNANLAEVVGMLGTLWEHLAEIFPYSELPNRISENIVESHRCVQRWSELSISKVMKPWESRRPPWCLRAFPSKTCHRWDLESVWVCVFDHMIWYGLIFWFGMIWVCVFLACCSALFAKSSQRWQSHNCILKQWGWGTPWTHFHLRCNKPSRLSLSGPWWEWHYVTRCDMWNFRIRCNSLTMALSAPILKQSQEEVTNPGHS